MKVLPEGVTDTQIVQDFRAYVRWARENPPSAPAPYSTVGECASIYCYLHGNDHAEQVHSAVWADVHRLGDRDVVLRAV